MAIDGYRAALAEIWRTDEKQLFSGTKIFAETLAGSPEVEAKAYSYEFKPYKTLNISLLREYFR